MVATKLILAFTVLAVAAAETTEEKPKRDLLLGTYGYPYPMTYGAPLGYAPIAALPAAAPLGFASPLGLAAPMSYYAPAAPTAPIAAPLLDESAKYSPGKYDRMYSGVRPIYNPYLRF